MNLLERVHEIRRTAPKEMVEQTAADVLTRVAELSMADVVPVGDLAWLMAQMIEEMSAPKVYRRVVDDGVALRSQIG